MNCKASKVEEAGSLRIDLTGGTLDIPPIDLLISDVVTLNAATTLKSKIVAEKNDSEQVRIVSKNYKTTREYKKSDFTKEKLLSNYFKEFTFIAQILDYFELHQGIEIELDSDTPPGSGLGGSSVMGVTLFKVFCQLTGREFDRDNAISIVRAIESRILGSGPAGYQDYYPAVYGGILALTPTVEGVQVKDLYSKERADYIRDHFLLVYSGDARLSGINNWTVYKNFFDNDKETRKLMDTIAHISYDAFISLRDGKYDDFCSLVSKEGEARSKLFPSIVTDSMTSLRKKSSQKLGDIGLKVCGAGGGGCCLLISKDGQLEEIKKLVKEHGMITLPFEVEKSIS